LVVPFVTSIIYAFTIIKKEEEINGKFLEWSRDHRKVVEIFTLLAGADVEALIILESKIKISKFDIFNVELSETAKSRIFWGTCLNVVIEDIPQIVIQVSNFFFFLHYLKFS